MLSCATDAANAVVAVLVLLQYSTNCTVLLCLTKLSTDRTKRQRFKSLLRRDPVVLLCT